MSGRSAAAPVPRPPAPLNRSSPSRPSSTSCSTPASRMSASRSLFSAMPPAPATSVPPPEGARTTSRSRCPAPRSMISSISSGPTSTSAPPRIGPPSRSTTRTSRSGVPFTERSSTSLRFTSAHASPVLERTPMFGPSRMIVMRSPTSRRTSSEPSVRVHVAVCASLGSAIAPTDAARAPAHAAIRAALRPPFKLIRPISPSNPPLLRAA